MEISLPRIFVISFSDFSKRFSPLKTISPPLYKTGGFGKSCIIAFAETDLPHPDSPTIAKVLPFSRL